jgi:BirA family transcriptional regulator, biotin operon repressor / biotin---[acetyl-CoA-carboxylase] ligase
MRMDMVPLRGRFGRPLTYVEQCASTQRLLDGAPEGAVAAAGEQTEGRGRLGRTWQAPAGTSLLFSIVLVPPVPAARLPELSLVAGAAVAEAIESETGLRAEIKHPNDVLIAGRKVAGILAEANVGRVVLGVGVNVSQTKAQLPGAAATSLAVAGATVDPAELLATILERLELHYDTWVALSSRS